MENLLRETFLRVQTKASRIIHIRYHRTLAHWITLKFETFVWNNQLTYSISDDQRGRDILRWCWTGESRRSRACMDSSLQNYRYFKNLFFPLIFLFNVQKYNWMKIFWNNLHVVCQEAYGMTDLSPASWHELIGRLSEDPELFRLFHQ